jgi:hypothetical protein
MNSIKGINWIKQSKKKIYSKDDEYLLTLLFYFIVSFGIVSLMYLPDIIHVSMAQIENTSDKISPSNLYGCEPFQSKSYCFPFPSKFNSSEISNVSSFVYAAYNDKPVMVNGTDGLALALFANSLDSLEIPNKKNLNPNTFSVSFWVKDIPDPVLHGTVISHYSIKSNSGWFFESDKMQNSSNQNLRFAVSNNESKIFHTNTIPISTANFTHVVGTFDGLYLSIYKNGVLIDKTKFNGTYVPDPNVPFRIGGDAYGVPSKQWIFNCITNLYQIIKLKNYSTTN